MAENSLGGFATDPETLSFFTPVNSVSLFASGGGSTAEFRIEAFLGGVLVGSAEVASSSGAYSELAFSSMGGFDRVVLTELSGAFAYVYDDLSFTPTMVVPEPTTLAAFSVLVGVVGLQRSRRRRLGSR